MVRILLLIFRRMSNPTNLTYFVLFDQLPANLLEKQPILINYFLFHLFPEKSLNNDHLPSKLLQRNIF